MVSTKEIEEKGFEAFKRHLEKNLTDVIIENHLHEKVGYDSIVQHGGQTYYVELKASTSKTMLTNLRFTHQTIRTMHEAGTLNDMLVVHVYNLNDEDNPQFGFFRFGNIPRNNLEVEPTFIVHPRKEKNSRSFLRCIVGKWTDLLDVEPNKAANIRNIIDEPISNHMKLEINNTH